MTTSITKGPFTVTVRPDSDLELAIDGVRGATINRSHLPDLVHALLVVDDEPLSNDLGPGPRDGAFWFEAWKQQNIKFAELAVQHARLEKAHADLRDDLRELVK